MPRAFLLLLCSALLACSEAQPPLLATDVVVRPPLPGTVMGAAYLHLHNSTATPIVIDRVTSPDAVSVAMHESVLENGVVRMQELQDLRIPAHESVEFAAGGKHLMLYFADGVPEQITLQFMSADALLLSIDAVVGN